MLIGAGALLIGAAIGGVVVALLPSSFWSVSGSSLTPGSRALVWLTHPQLLFIFVQLIVQLILGVVMDEPSFPEQLLSAVLVVAGLVAVVVLWKVPRLQVRQVPGLTRRERFDRENEVRRTLATILGGAALLTSAYFGWRNLNLIQGGQITDRYTRAIVQLGDGSLMVRLGGIYSLEAVANESQNFHWPIMEVLTAYVREKAPASPPKLPGKAALDAHQQASPPDQDRPGVDIQAILYVLGRRKRDDENFLQNPNLSRTNLEGADLHEANFESADFEGTNLSSADLEGANLHGAFLKCGNLRTAEFEQTNLKGAFLGGADLQTAKDLTQLQIDSAFGNRRTRLPPDLHPPSGWYEVIVGPEDLCSPPS